MLYWPALRPKQIVLAFDLLRGRRNVADAALKAPRRQASADNAGPLKPVPKSAKGR